jgi:hypothetical protein
MCTPTVDIALRGALITKGNGIGRGVFDLPSPTMPVGGGDPRWKRRNCFLLESEFCRRRERLSSTAAPSPSNTQRPNAPFIPRIFLKTCPSCANRPVVVAIKGASRTWVAKTKFQGPLTSDLYDKPPEPQRFSEPSFGPPLRAPWPSRRRSRYRPRPPNLTPAISFKPPNYFIALRQVFFPHKFCTSVSNFQSHASFEAFPWIFITSIKFENLRRRDLHAPVASPR